MKHNLKDENQLLQLEPLDEWIKSGVENAYYQDLRFKNSASGLLSKISEYLITTNIAQKIFECKNDAYKNCIIALEYGANEFQLNAFPRISFENGRLITNTVIPFTGDKERIDIALLEQAKFQSLRSKVGIEVKGIDKSFSLILNDLERMAKAMSEGEANSNSINNCYATFIERLDTPTQIPDIKMLETLLLDRREALITDTVNSLKIYPAITPKIYAWEIYNQPVDDAKERIPQEQWEKAEMAEMTGAAIGVILKLTRS